MSFNRNFVSVFLAVVLASVTDALSRLNYANYSTHGIMRGNRYIGRNFVIFHPVTRFETYDKRVEDQHLDDAFVVPDRLNASIMSFVRSRLSDKSTDFVYRNGHSTEWAQFSYFQQSREGVPFANAVAHVVWKDNMAIAFGSSFVDIVPGKIAPSKPSRSVRSVLARTEEALEGKYTGHPPTIEYLARSDGSASLVHVVQIRNESVWTSYEAFVDAHTGELLSVTDFVSDAKYTVVSISKQSIAEGLDLVLNPDDLNKWHDERGYGFGNNVIVHPVDSGHPRLPPPGIVFYGRLYDDTKDATFPGNLEAARINVFYIINSMHDIAYEYGFTESTYNFQYYNHDRGGKEHDPVHVFFVDNRRQAGTFRATADGLPSTLILGIPRTADAGGNPALANDILVHEMTHGITNRMTGGGTARCLQTGEAGGLGEGWSDAIAEWTVQKSATITDLCDGHVRFPQPCRHSLTPLLNKPHYQSTAILEYSRTQNHIGEVWANILHNVYAALVDAHGFSSTARTDPYGQGGNVVYLHLFMDGLLLQPCNPTFVDARNAWIKADSIRYGGANECLLWKAFASRGLGLKADIDYKDDSSVPAWC